MPFLGKDWRSSGEQWIRTEHGWERTRVLECILDNLNLGLSKEKLLKSKKQKLKTTEKRLNSVNDDNEDDEEMMEERSSQIDEEEEGWNYVYDELSLLSDDEENDDEDDESSTSSRRSTLLRHSASSSQSLVRRRQPHIIYWEVDTVNRENNAPKATISEVLNALDMPGAVKDIKRFNYVCRLVQIVINEKLNQLSGNAQRTLFMIVKHMLIQVIKSQENLNVMRKLLHDFKKKIQDSIYFYFYYIGSQKLCDRHLATITKWQEILENPNHHKRLKRLHSTTSMHNSTTSNANKRTSTQQQRENDEEYEDEEGEKENNNTSFESIPIDCKLEIIRRLNCGLDLVNLSQCNRNLNDLISSELKIWKNLCQFHFQQASINSFVNRLNKTSGEQHSGFGSKESSPDISELDWKSVYFRLKRRFGHREIYADMVHKCYHCKSLFWKEIGHPCVILESLAYPDSLEMRSEPITPKKLIELLLK